MVEILGSWSSEAVFNIKKIGQSIGQKSSPTFSAETVKHLFGHLAMALWQGMPLCGIVIPTHFLPSRTEWYIYIYIYIYIYFFLNLFNCLIFVY